MADKERILELKREAVVLKRQGDLAGAKAKLAEATLLQYSHLDYATVDDCAVLKKIAWALKRQNKTQEHQACLQKIATIQQPPTTTIHPPLAPPSAQPTTDESVPTRLHIEATSIQENTSHKTQPIPAPKRADPAPKERNREVSTDVDVATGKSSKDAGEANAGSQIRIQPPLNEEPPPAYVPRKSTVDDSAKDVSDVVGKGDVLKSGSGHKLSEAKDDVVEHKPSLEASKGRAKGEVGEDMYEAEYAELSDGDIDDEDLLQEYQALMSEGSSSQGSPEKEEPGLTSPRAEKEEDDLEDGLGFDDLTDEDMLDYESLAELDAVPAKAAYEARVLANKKIAIKFKKAGDLEKAKEHLRMSKALQAICIKVYGGETPEQEKKKIVPAPKLTAAELKAQAIAFKQEGKLKEAASTFRKYKAVQEEEEKAATALAAEEARQRKIANLRELQNQVKKEIEVARLQLVEFAFIAHLGTPSEVAFAETQKQLWTQYISKCSSFLVTSAKPSHFAAMPDILRRDLTDLKELGPGDGLQVDPSAFEDDEIVLTILSANRIEGNVELRKKPELPKNCPLRVEYSIGSLTGEKDPVEGKSKLALDPFEFGTKASLKIERSKRSERRLVRRKLDLRVYQVQIEQRQKGGGLNRFFGGAKEECVEVAKKFIGRVSIELKGLLDKTSLGGGLELMNKSNTKPVGGLLYVALNVSSPFGDLEEAHVPCEVQAKPFHAIQFS